MAPIKTKKSKKTIKPNIIKDFDHDVEVLRPETCKAMREFLNECYDIFLKKHE